MADIEEWIRGAILIIVVTFILFVITKTFCSTEPSFCNIGWYLFGAFIIGAALYLKYGWKG